jgi:hypothetical protein
MLSILYPLYQVCYVRRLRLGDAKRDSGGAVPARSGGTFNRHPKARALETQKDLSFIYIARVFGCCGGRCPVRDIEATNLTSSSFYIVASSSPCHPPNISTLRCTGLLYAVLSSVHRSIKDQRAASQLSRYKSQSPLSFVTTPL